MSKHLRSIILIILAVVAVFIVVERFVQPSEGETRLDYGAFYQKLEAGQVQSFHATGLNAVGDLSNGTKYTVAVPNVDQTFVDEVYRKVKSGAISFDQQSNAGLLSSLMTLGPLAITVLLLFFILRQAQSGGSQALSFGRSRAKMLSENRPKVTFADVAGVDEAKEELAEIVDFLKYPKKYQSLGARIPKGVLLLGPPGTGKTLLARAIAGEAGVPFLSISGSDFVEMFVGVGASRVRDLFDQAKKSAPCIVFIDEIDAVGRQRGAGLGGGHDEREQTLNQLLVEMDGFDQNTGVILIAATNRADVLDPALLRPGRFDRQIVVGRADFKGREKILEVHARNKPLGKEVSLETLAKRTPGFSGADLENLLNEAALLAARKNKNFIEMIDCDEAIDRVMVGPERKSLVMSQKEKETTAYHESGHAIIGGLLEKADPVHKVTIIPRGMALGITWSLPEDDRHSQTREELLAAITMAMGGRLAEEIKFGDVTTGASNDFEKATELARRMVTQYGMSDLGPIQFGRGAHQVFLGRDFGDERNYSEEVASKIDAQVRKIIESCYANGRDLLEKNWDKVERMVESLLEYETVEAEEVQAILAARPFDRKVGTEVAEAPVERPAEEPEEARETLAIPPKDLAETGMTARAVLVAGLLAVAASLTAATPVHAAMARDIGIGSLPRGGSYIVDPDPTIASAAIGLWFRAPGAGYDNATPGLSNLAATSAAVAPLASGKSLYALVHSLGGQVNIAVYPDIVGIGAVVPASAARRVVAAMTGAYFAPSIDETAVKMARANAAVLGVQQRYQSDQTLHDLLFKQIFASGPAVYPALPTSITQLTSITTAQVRSFAQRAFRSENAVLTLTGNVDASSVSAVTDGSGNGAMDQPYDSTPAPSPAAATVSGAVDGVGLAWIGPPISDQRAATALDFVADYLFREATGVVWRGLDTANSDALVLGQFITLHNPGVMVVTIGGDHEKQAEKRVLDALETMRQPLDKKTFESAREAFLYHVASDTQTPQQRADNFGWYTVEGNLQYAPGIIDGAYYQVARSLDPEYVASVVRRYLDKPIVVDLIAVPAQKGSTP